MKIDNRVYIPTTPVYRFCPSCQRMVTLPCVYCRAQAWRAARLQRTNTDVTSALDRALENGFGDHDAHTAAAHRRQTPSPETRAKIAAAQRGKRPSPETRAKMAAAHRGKRLSPETRAKMAAAQRGKRHSPETRAKIAATMRRPEIRAKIAAARLLTHHRPSGNP